MAGKPMRALSGRRILSKRHSNPKRNAPRRPRLKTCWLAYVRPRYQLTEATLLAPGRARQPAEARALICWLAIKTQAALLTTLARVFKRDISTLRHAASRFDARARNDAAFANTLDQHLKAISQA